MTSLFAPVPGPLKYREALQRQRILQDLRDQFQRERIAEEPDRHERHRRKSADRIHE